MTASAVPCDHFAQLYRSWLAREQLTRTGAAGRLGISVQTSHDYASGSSLPPRPALGRLALGMGLAVAEVAGAVDADRASRRAAAVAQSVTAGAPLTPASHLPRPSAATTTPATKGW